MKNRTMTNETSTRFNRLGGKALPKFCGLRENDFALTPKETRAAGSQSGFARDHSCSTCSLRNSGGPKLPSPLKCWGPHCPSPALWGTCCLYVWVLNTVRHTGTFSDRKPARPLAETVYRLSLTHFPVHFPSWLN